MLDWLGEELPALPVERQQNKLELPKGLGPLLPAHRRYLKSRGFDPDDLARLWGIQGIGLARKLAWRIWIPIHFRGQVISWTTRSLGNAGLRYITAKPGQEVLPAKSVLYGFDHVNHATIIVEGPTDVWNLGPGAVGTLGVGWTQAQLTLLAQIPVRTVCFDPEPKAQERAKQLCNELAAFPGRTSRVVIDAEDPGSADKREVALLRRKFL